MPEKLMFYELAEGELAQQVQKDFEEAQNVAHARGVKTKITLEITIHPESREQRGTAMVEYKSQVKAPARASIKHITEINREGQLIDAGIRQNDMFDKEKK